MPPPWIGMLQHVHHTCRVDPGGPPATAVRPSFDVASPAGSAEIGRTRPIPEHLNERMRSIAHSPAAMRVPREARTGRRGAESDGHPLRRAVSTSVPAGLATVVFR